MVKKDLNAIFEAIHSNDSLAGVHSCAAMDWTILYESMVDIVNLDVYNFGRSLLPFARETGEFLERGGAMAWGIVPTYEAAFEEDFSQIHLRGCPITPFCHCERPKGAWQSLEK